MNKHDELLVEARASLSIVMRALNNASYSVSGAATQFSFEKDHERAIKAHDVSLLLKSITDDTQSALNRINGILWRDS